MVYLVQFLVSFGAVFLKGFQQQNVIAGNIKVAGSLSFLLICFDVAIVSMVVSSGWMSVIPLGLGASIGIMLSIYIFRRIRKESNHTNSTLNR